MSGLYMGVGVVSDIGDVVADIESKASRPYDAVYVVFGWAHTCSGNIARSGYENCPPQHLVF